MNSFYYKTLGGIQFRYSSQIQTIDNQGSLSIYLSLNSIRTEFNRLWVQLLLSSNTMELSILYPIEIQPGWEWHPIQHQMSKYLLQETIISNKMFK